MIDLRLLQAMPRQVFDDLTKALRLADADASDRCKRLLAETVGSSPAVPSSPLASAAWASSRSSSATSSTAPERCLRPLDPSRLLFTRARPASPVGASKQCMEGQHSDTVQEARPARIGSDLPADRPPIARARDLVRSAASLRPSSAP